MEHVQEVVVLVNNTRQECKVLKEDISVRSICILRKMQRSMRIKVTVA